MKQQQTIEISISKETLKKLENFGKMNETLDELLAKMADHISTCDSWWLNRY